MDVAASRFRRLGVFGAASTLAGILLSGPVAIVALNASFPQPPWHDAERFVANYHPAQAFPYFAGFFLVGGYVVLAAGLHALAREEMKARTALAMIFTSVFATFVFFNYAIQTTFIPSLVRQYSSENAPIVSAFSMANPRSLAWALEMWGYGFLGVASWLLAPVFSNGPLERATAATFVANGAVSTISAFLTAIAPGWPMTGPGLVGFTVWNVLAFAMSTLALMSLRRRESHSSSSSRQK